MGITTHAALAAAKVCPKAPPGAQEPVNEILSYVVWGVITLFVVGIVVSLGAVVGSRAFAMPHAGKVAVIGVVVVFAAAIAYLVLPGMLNGILGNGCL